jgi:hypothetical protein
VLCTIVNPDPRRFAKKLIVSGFVRILEAPPATYVVNEDRLERTVASQNVLK